MFFLCIVQDLATSQFELTQYLEASKQFHLNHVQSVAWGVATSIFFFFYMNNLIYWLYGFKYWVISIEVPGAYTKRDRCKLPETSYKLISWTGVVVNFALCFAIAYQRYYLSLAIANGTANTAKFDT